MKTVRMMLVLAAGAALAATAAFGQPGADRAELERRLEALRAQQAEIELRLVEMNSEAPEQAEREELLRGLPSDLRERFEAVRREHPERAGRMMEQHRSRLHELEKLRESDPAAHQRRVESMEALRRAGELAAEVAQLEDAGKLTEAAEARAKLRSEAEFVFDRVLERQRADVARVEAKLAEAMERLATMEEDRGLILDARVDQAIERARGRLKGEGDRRRGERRRGERKDGPGRERL